jgi:hypothetical protein
MALVSDERVSVNRTISAFLRSGHVPWKAPLMNAGPAARNLEESNICL